MPTGFVPFDTSGVKYVRSAKDIPVKPDPSVVYMIWDGVDYRNAVRYETTSGKSLQEAKTVKNSIIGMLGDSRSNNSGKNGISENIGPLHWACMKSRQRLAFHSSYNFSVGGYNTQDIIDNLLEQACASYPDSFYVLAGTNDRATLSSAQTIINLRYIVDRLVAAGKDVYLDAELPRGDTTFTNYRLNTAQLKAHIEVHDWILSLRGERQVYPVDSWPNIAVKTSTTGDVLPGITIDGLHPATKCAYLIGYKALADQIIANYPAAPSVLPTSNSMPDLWLNANPMLDGTAGGTLGTGGSGSLATSYNASAGSTVGGITRVYSKTAEGYQQVVIGGTAASGTNPTLDLMRVTGLVSSITAGRSVYVVADMEMNASSSNITSLQLGIQVTLADTTSVYVWDGERYDNNSLMPADAISGVWMTQPITVPEGATAVSLLVRAFGVGSAASTGTVIVKSLGIRYA